MKHIIATSFLTLSLIFCYGQESQYDNFDNYPIPEESNLSLNYSKNSTEFSLWSPKAENVSLKLYEKGNGELQIDELSLEAGLDGAWSTRIKGDLHHTP